MMVDILNIKLGDNDAGAETVKGYLKALLTELWEKEEGFSGKRPFGNSGWKHHVELALINAGMVSGTIDSEGFINECDCDKSDELILAAIAAL